MQSLLNKYKSIAKDKSSTSKEKIFSVSTYNEEKPAKRKKGGEEISVSLPSCTTRWDNIISIIFEGNDGFGSNSITHYYHFFFGAMIPLIEFHLARRSSGYKIATDVGPMKSLLCELPLNIVEIVGPDKSLTRSDADTHPDHIALPAYDNFIESKFRDQYVPHMKKATLQKVQNYYNVPPFNFYHLRF